MNEFSANQPTPARFHKESKAGAAWRCPQCGAELARVKTWPSGESRLIVAGDFIRDQQGTYQKPKTARRWIKTRAGRDYAARLQTVIDHAEAKARRLEAEAQETNTVAGEEPNSPGAQARCCRQYAQIIRGTLDSLKRSETLWLSEKPSSAARRKLLEQWGINPPTMAEREQSAAQAWTDPKEFTAAQISEQPLMFLCCGHLHPVRSVRGIA